MNLQKVMFLPVFLLLASHAAAQGDILEVAKGLGCDIFYDWMNTSEFIPESIIDVPDTYTLFAVRDTDIPEGVERMIGWVVPVLRGRHMSYFIVNGTYKEADFKNDMLIDSATIGHYAVRQLRMNVYNVSGTDVYTIDGRRIVSFDNAASNGVVHLIDGFLFYETNTVGERIEATSRYSKFQDSLAKVELLDVLLGDRPYTVFVPTNDAFNDLLSMKNNNTRILDSKHPLTGIIRGHIALSTYFDDALYDGFEMQTVGNGRIIQTSVDSFGNITLNGGQAKVISQRIMKNGVLYEIDGVLTIPTDLRDNTMMDVAQDLGCNYMLDYLYRGLLYDTLRGDFTGGATLFALEDAGFTDGVRMRLDSVFPQLLRNYMIYHVAEGDYPTDQISNDQLAPCIDGYRKLRFNLYGDVFNQVFTVAGRPINHQNTEASNGLVHTIDTFITSESWTSCGYYIELSGSLSELEILMDSVELIDVLKGTDPFTVFAPINEAFNGTDIPDAQLAETLEAHIVPSTYFTVGLTHNLQLVTRNNKAITVTVDPATDVITLNGHSNIIQERVVGNGVVHLVDDVLFSDGVFPTPSPSQAPTTENGSGGLLPPSSILIMVTYCLCKLM